MWSVEVRLGCEVSSSESERSLKLNDVSETAVHENRAKASAKRGWISSPTGMLEGLLSSAPASMIHSYTSFQAESSWLAALCHRLPLEHLRFCEASSP